MDKPVNQPLLFEMLRSFTTLAQTLNLSQTVARLGSTRQTVRRHITLLEQARGEKLFELRDRQYVLTDAGEQSLREAHAILERGQAWLMNVTGHVGGLEHLSVTLDGEAPYHLQQHPIERIWTHGPEFLREAARAWTEAGGQIEHPALADIRPWLMVYRRTGEDWLCVEIGEQSSYATWFGWAWARSSVGRPLGGMPGGQRFAEVMGQPFEDVWLHRGLRLDHIHARIKDANGSMSPINYQRLLMGCRFPDGDFALAAMVHRSRDLEIEGVTAADLAQMPESMVMPDVRPGAEAAPEAARRLPPEAPQAMG